MYFLLEILGALLPVLMPLILIGIIYFVRIVPPNSLIIVDRNTHYLKTKRKGFYFLNPSTDKVTTHIATLPLTKKYVNYFETHDGEIVYVSFSAKYHAENLEDVKDALASARRSVNDIIQSSVYWGVSKLTLKDFVYNPSVLSREAKIYLDSEAIALKITIDNFTIHSVHSLKDLPTLGNNVRGKIMPFKPHLSSSSSNGPIRFN